MFKGNRVGIRSVAGGEARRARVPREIFRFELNSNTNVEFYLLNRTAVYGSYSSVFPSKYLPVFHKNIKEAKWIEMHQ